MSNHLLKGKRGIIFGALNNQSIAWKVAQRAHEEGATFVLTNAPIAMRMGEINELAAETGSQVIGADATKNQAGVRTHHPVEHHAVGARLLELHLRVFTNVETLPIDRGAVAALLNHHIGAAGTDLGLTRANLAALGQGVGWWCRLGVGALRQKAPQNSSNN